MTSRLAPRRRRNVVLTGLVAIALTAAFYWGQQALLRVDLISGGMLLAAVWFLALLHLRKKLPSLPIGSVASWLQVHLYVAVLSILVFGLHIGWKIPNGVLETSLALFFVLVAGSGLCGLYLSRTIPKRLANVGEEILYERIPFYRRGLQEQSRKIVLQAAAVADSPVLVDFYHAKLQTFLSRPRGWMYRINPSSRRRRFLLAELQGLQRYLSDAERTLAEQLFAVVRKKDDLDYHEALQSVLRGWLWLHIGLTYPLLILGTLHGLIAWAFVGAAI